MLAPVVIDLVVYLWFVAINRNQQTMTFSIFNFIDK